MSPKPTIGEHDDRAFYHRRRWERSERSETTSASRTVSNTRTDAIGDAAMIASGVLRRVRNNSVGRCHVEIFCSADAVQRLPSGTQRTSCNMCPFYNV